MQGGTPFYNMSTTPTKLNILNSALRKVGSYHLEASDTTSATYEIVNQAYLDAILEVFSENIFNYNTKKAALTAVNSESPSTDSQYEYYYTLPSDFNLLTYLTDKEGTSLLTDYTFYDNQLHASEKELCMYYTFVPDLSGNATDLPAFLNRLVVLHIAQAIAIELSGSENRHELLHNQYVKALRRARTLEARQGNPQFFINDRNSRTIATHHSYGSIY